MTYQPPANRVAITQANTLFMAGIRLSEAASKYGIAGTAETQRTFIAAADAFEVAFTKLRDHLRDMARSEQVAS